MLSSTKKWLLGGVGAAAAVAAIALWPTSSKAADLGGNCCSDLEERIAELEATVARKGNRKIRLVISGQVSKGVLWHDIDGLAGADKLRVIDNPLSGTRVTFSGDAKIGTNMMAGFVFELGSDETKGDGLGLAVDDLSLRHSHVWLSSPAGKITLGRASSATDGIVEIDASNSGIASLPMSTEPIWSYTGLGTFAGGILNPTAFDGGRANILRYDTPTMGGFQASAAWGGGQTASGDDLFDVALRYAGEFGQLRVAAGAGYRVEKFDSISATDMKTLAGSISVMHTISGLFLNGAYGDQQDNPLFGDVQMWQVKGGWEKKVFAAGATTIFAEYGDHKLKDLSIDSTFFGGGIVQKIDDAAMDLFVSYRAYDIDGFDAQVGMAGARIRF